MSGAERTSCRRGNNAARRTGQFRLTEDNAYPVVTVTSTKTSASETSTIGITGGRRRKSRSPGPAQARVESTINTTAAGKKRKSTASSSSTATSSLHFSDDTAVDRGRKVKLKLKTHSRHAVENSTSVVEQQHPHRSSGKERSRSRDAKEQLKKHSVPETGASEEKSVRLSGAAPTDNIRSSDAIEFLRVKKEVDILKKQAHENKKTICKQTKVIDELRLKLNIADKTIKENEQQIQKIKSKAKKSEEILSTVEGNVNCQVCIEVLLKPFALSPCGHVLCYDCLQEWFRKAPVNDEDMYDDDDPDFLIYRTKTCPCCRANVRERPIPVFMVKSIAVALMKGKPSSLSAGIASPPVEGDPWADLFPPASVDVGGQVDEDDENEDAEDEDYDNDEDEDEDEDEDDYNEVFSYGSEDEHYDGEYVYPQWQPPKVSIDPIDYEFEDLDNDDLNVLRRGATIEMLDMYQMRYTHAEGLVAKVGEEHEVYLGWNIRLSADDDTGEEYMDYLLQDMVVRPERWSIAEGLDDGISVCRMLVKVCDIEDYGTTDSEVWIGIDDDD